jgi:hypothetical protein
MNGEAKKDMKRIVMIVLLAAISMVTISNALNTPEKSPLGEAVSAGVDNSSTLNETAYINLITNMWLQYSDDFVYASNILDRYVKNNTSNERAMVATASLYILNSRNLKTITSIKPPEKYSNYHNDTMAAFYYFEEYLSNIARYYETGKSNYVTEALQYYNLTTTSRDKALEEALMI